MSAYWIDLTAIVKGQDTDRDSSHPHLLRCSEFLRRHVCRLDPPPAALFESLAGFNSELYETMWGPSDFFPTGRLANWDVEDRLGEIDLPTLITSGRFDEATPAHMERLRDGIPGSRWVCFEQSSHSAFLEEPEPYRTVLADFLDHAEGGNATRS